MSNKQSFPFWSDEWAKAQQTYWDTITSMGQTKPRFNSGMPSMENPWTQMLDQWGSMLRNNSSDHGAQSMFDGVLGQGKAFFQLGEQFNSFLSTCAEINKSGNEWQDALRKQFDQFKSQYLAMGNGDQGSATFWNLPLDTWQRTMSSASLMPGDLMQTMKAGGWDPSVTEGLHEHMEKFLSVPNVGYTRESQDKVQQSGKLWLDYNRASQEYAAAHGKLMVTTSERLIERIIAISEQGEEINGLRQIYDIWVDCGEEAYLEFTSTEEFADIYGRMANTLMALKQHSRTSVDETLGALGMPTRQGFDTLLRRHQELRREVATLKANQDPTGTSELTVELKELKQRIAELETTLEATAKLTSSTAAKAETSDTAVTKKAPRTKKKTAKKKTTATRPSTEGE